MFAEFQIVLVLVAEKKVCQRNPAGILIYMATKSMILFMINYHKPEVKHEIARARLPCMDSILVRLGLPGYGKVSVRNM